LDEHGGTQWALCTSRRRYRDAHELHSSRPCISRFAGVICACCADVDTLRIVKIRTERWSCRTGPSAASCARDYYEVMRIGRINDRIGWPPLLRMLLSARTLRYLFRFSNWLTLKPGPDTLPPQRGRSAPYRQGCAGWPCVQIAGERQCHRALGVTPVDRWRDKRQAIPHDRKISNN
jgi:hypothetical protein